MNDYQDCGEGGVASGWNTTEARSACNQRTGKVITYPYRCGNDYASYSQLPPLVWPLEK